MQTKNLFPLLAAALVVVLLVFNSCRKIEEIVAPHPDYPIEIPQNVRCDTVTYGEGQNQIKRVVCYAPGEVITNTTDYTPEDEQALFRYLEEKGFTPTDTCKCQLKLIRWGDPSKTVNVIGSVDDPPPRPRPQGDSIIGASVAANVFVGMPRPVFRQDQNRRFQGKDPNSSLPRIVVGILDTGVDTLSGYFGSRTAFPASVVCPMRAFDMRFGIDICDEKAGPMDGFGHGSHVAGIVAGVYNPPANANIRMHHIKVSQGNTSAIFLFDMLCGLYYALEKGGADLRIINCSLGWEDHRVPELMTPLMNEIAKRNILFVAGAGNDGVRDLACRDTTRRFWPAAYSRYGAPDVRKVVVSVGAWDTKGIASDMLWDKSNQCFDLAAPGVEIESLLPGNMIAPCSGTSMAAPMVSRKAAEIIAMKPDISAEKVKESLLLSCTLRPVRMAPTPRAKVRVLLESAPLVLAPGS